MTLHVAPRRLLRAVAADPAETFAGFAQPDLLMSRIDLGYAVLCAVCASEVFFTAGGQERDNTARRLSDVHQMCEVAREAGTVERVMRVTSDASVVTIGLPPIRLRVLGVPLDVTPQQAAALRSGRQIIRGLFPALDVDRVGSPGDHRDQRFVLPETVRREMPLEVLAGINVEGVPRLDLGAGWERPLRGSVTLELTPGELVTDQPADRVQDHVDFRISVMVRVHVALPRAYCKWAQSAASEAEYVPYATWLQFRAQRAYASGAEGAIRPQPRVPHPDRAQIASRTIAEHFAIAPTPRTDELGICVLPDGSMAYAPEAPGASVGGVMRECVRDGVVDVAPLLGRHLFTDWTSCKMAVSDPSGTIHLINLNGARAPSDAVLAHVMEFRVDEPVLKGLEALGNRLNVPVRIAPAVGLEGVTWSNLLDRPYHGDEESPERQQVDEALFAIGRRLGELYQALASSDVPLHQQVRIRPYLALFGPYRARRAACVRALTEQTAHNRVAIDPTAVPTLHDMPGVEGVMPHQRRVIGAMNTAPLGAILDVRAGGGKSLTAITDVMNLMHLGVVNRPVAIMPRNLLGNFANEVDRFTGGRLRPFVISNRTWRTLTRRFGASPAAALALMNRQPRNTIFLVDYGWLTHESESIALGNDEEPVYPRALLLQQIRPDYCVLDESHRAKRATSGRTEAAAMISGVARYRRIMSGTLLHNTAVDMVGQMAQIEPMALGDLGAQIRENRRVSIDQLPELRRCVDAFARTITVPRKEWAHLLPPLIERAHPCEMTPRQRKFYGQIYERLQEEIRADPKIRALMKKDSTGAQARLQAILRRKFVPMEQWLNAPDSEFSNTQFGQVFGQLEGVTEADLRSPKIDVLDGILQQHFEGGSTVLDDGHEEHVPPDPNKVLVFCYNKAVLEHVFRHSRFAPMGLKYEAGDDEVIERFKSDDAVRIMYATVTGIAEGHNLQCFPGYTEVLIDYDKSVPIEEVFANPEITHVLSYDLDKRRIERRRILRKLRHDVDEDDRYLQVTVRDERDGRVSSLVLTDEHPVFLRDGSEVPVRDVKRGDRFITYGGEFARHAVHPDTREIVERRWLKGRPRRFACPECGETITSHNRVVHMWKRHGKGEKAYREYVFAKSAAGHAAHDVPENRERYERGLRRVWRDPEFRARMNDARFKRWDDPQQRHEASLRMRAMWEVPEFREIVAAGMQRYWESDEAHENQSARSKRGWRFYRTSIIAGIRRGLADPAVRKRLAHASRAMWADPETRARIVASMVTVANTPERRELRRAATRRLHMRPGFTATTVAAMLDGQGVFPNAPERAIIDLGYDELKYTGDGRYFVTIDWRGNPRYRKNPDFISTDHYRVNAKGRRRTTKVIEVVGARQYTGRGVRHDASLVDAYKRAGIDCTIIEDRDASGRPDVARAKIESLLNNHYLEVLAVSEVSERHRESVVGRYKYDLTVEGHHNYFAVAGSRLHKRPKIPVLVHNCASRVIELQTYWTPGLGEQSLARAWRPDVPDKNGHIRYKRDRIWRDVIFISPSIEVAKMARLIAKQVSNLIVEEIDTSPSLRGIVQSNAATFDKMTTIPLSLDNLKKLQDQESLNTYFRAYSLVKAWERREFAEARDRVRAEIETRVGRRVANWEISALSMTRPENVDTPAFAVPEGLQARGYLPWTEGYTGATYHGLHLVPLAMPSSADEEDEEESGADDDEAEDQSEQTVQVARGDPVLTELGPGRVASARAGARTINVIVPGFSADPVRLWRYAVLAATTVEDRRALGLIVDRSGSDGLSLLQRGTHGQVVPRDAIIGADVIQRAREAVRRPDRPDPRGARGVIAPERPRVPAPGEATRADLVRERGRIHIGNHEAVLLTSKRTGNKAWIVRHLQDPRDRSAPFGTDQKRAAVDELLRRHNEAQTAPAAGRARGVRSSDPFAGTPVVPGGGATRATRARRVSAPVSLTSPDQFAEKRDVREAQAGLFSGTVCLVTTDGGDRDELLLKSGFDRLARRMEIRVRNPRAYRQLVSLLESRFTMPAVNAQALELFGDQYQAAKANVAYLRAREMPQHLTWLRQQRTKARADDQIMPWPIVRGGLVFVCINIEQLRPRALTMLKRLQVPVGCVKPQTAVPAQMIAMLKSVTAARTLMKSLRDRGVDIENQDEVIQSLRRIKG